MISWIRGSRRQIAAAAIAAGLILAVSGCLLPRLERPTSKSTSDGGPPSSDVDSGGSGTPDLGGGDVTSEQVATMMGNHCTGSNCHSNDTFPPTLPDSPGAEDVEALIGREAENTDNATYVTRGSRDESLIYQRMKKGEMPNESEGWGEFTEVDRENYDSDEAAGEVVTEKIGKWIDAQ